MEQKKDTKELKNRYQREWRAKNKDKVKQHNQNFWSKKAQQLQDGQKIGPK